MSKELVNTGKPFERRVADAYRALGARRVEHDKEIGGHQVDVYVEFNIPDGSLHRIAVEAKDHRKPIGIGIVNDFAKAVSGLRRLGHIDVGVIVSVSGYTKPARNRADEEGLILITLGDLEAKQSEVKQLQASIDELLSRLGPFEELAVQFHPDLGVDEALKELRQDIKRLEEVAAKHEFTPLSNEIRACVIENLRAVAKIFTHACINVLLTCETWTTVTTREFAEQLATILREAGFNVAGPEFATVYLATPTYPLEWGFNQDEEKLIEPLYSVLCSIIEPRERYAIRRSFPKGKVRIHFAGQAIFRRNGTVFIE